MIKPAHIVSASILLLFPILGLANILPWKTGKGLILAYLATSISVCLFVNSGVVSRPHWHSALPLALIVLILAGYAKALYTIPDVISTTFFLVIAVSHILFYLLAIVVAGTAISARSVAAMMFGSCVGLHLLNMTLWLLGVENENVLSQYTGEHESMFDFLGPRQLFPLGGDIAESSLISALGGLSALSLLKWPLLQRSNNAIRLVLILAYASGLFGVALTGNRMTALVFIVATLVTLAGGHLFMRRSAVTLAAGLYLFPLIYVAIFPLIEYTGNLNWLAGLSRTGNIGDVLTLNNRVFIWSEVLSQFFQENSAFLFGYGAYGQVVGGISGGYLQFFEGVHANPEFTSPHSTALQLMADIGIVGAGLFLLILMFSVRKAQALRDREVAGPVSMLLVAFAAFSSVESELGVDSVIHYLFLFFVMYLAAIKQGIKRSGGK